MLFLLRKNLLLIGLACLLTVLTGATYLAIHSREPLRVDGDTRVPEIHPAVRQRICGFKYNASLNGNQSISILADEVSLEKKKLGFFRFGLLQELRFSNVKIIIRSNGRDSTASEQDKGPHNISSEHNAVASLLSKNAFRAFGGKHIASVLMSPVMVQLFRGESLISQIQARKAKVRLLNKEVVFEGDVTLRSLGRHLKTSLLVLAVETGNVHIPRKFVFYDSDGKIGGSHLVSDIFLSHVQAALSKAKQHKTHGRGHENQLREVMP